MTRTMPLRLFLTFAATLVVFATHADAAPTAAAKCASSKIKGSAKAVSSRTKCEAKGLSRGEATDPSCVSGANAGLTAAFSNAEGKGGCEPSSGQAGDAQAAVDACLDGFVAAITGDGSCASAKMKAVGKDVSSLLKCWQKGSLSGADADIACLSKATLKFGSAVEKADARGTCSGTAATLAVLVESCVESLLAPGTTTTTVPETTTTTLPETTTTTVLETTTTTVPETTTTTLPETTTTTSTTITTTTTDTTTTTLIDIGPVGWTFCAHAGETCVLPRHDLPISFMGFPPASGHVTAIDGLSVECSAEVLFPGNEYLHGFSGDCYYLNAGCDYETKPFGVAVLRDSDFSTTVNVATPTPTECVPFVGGCRFVNGISGDLINELSIFVVDPRVCDADDRARLSYHWIIRHPSGANNNMAVFAPRGITGYFSRSLAFDFQTMPTLDGLGGDRSWYAEIQITQELHEDFPLSTSADTTYHPMRFRYMDAAYSLAQSNVCQARTEPGLPCEGDTLLRHEEGTY